VSSLVQLNGVSCDSGAGTASLSYGSNGAVSITCVTPKPTTSPGAGANLYWTTFPSSTTPGTIWEANLDGSSEHAIVSGGQDFMEGGSGER
jgi:hypothetical protein